MNGGYRRYKDKYFCRVARQAARRTNALRDFGLLRSSALSSRMEATATGTSAAAPAAAAEGAHAAADDRHAPFAAGQLGANTPAKRAAKADIWEKKLVRRIRGSDGRALALALEGYTHVCTISTPDGPSCA